MARTKKPAEGKVRPPRGVGQPTKLTPELQTKLCGILELCNVLEDAALYCGVARTTVFMWIQKGRAQGSGKYRDFLDAVETAKARRRININTSIMQAGKRDWKAYAWIGERTDPKHFGLQVRVKVNEELELIMEKLEANLTPQEYERALEAISQPDDSGAEVDEDPRSASAGGRGFAPAVGAAVESALSESDAP